MKTGAFLAIGLLVLAGGSGAVRAVEKRAGPGLSTPNPRLSVRSSEQVLTVQGGGDFTLASPGDIVVDSAGGIHVLDAMSRTVKRLSSTGGFLGEIGGKGAGEALLDYPTGLGIDRQDRLYVTDRGPLSRIVVFDGEGRFVRQMIAPPPGAAGPADPRGSDPQPALRDVAVNAAGRVFATDNALHRLLIFGSDGVFVREVGHLGGAPGDLNYPGWLAINDKDEVHVCNGFNRRIEVFDADGAFLRSYGTSKYFVGSFFSPPAGIAFDDEGNSIVVDPTMASIQFFSPDGTYLFHLGGEDGAADMKYRQRALIKVRRPVGVAYSRKEKMVLFSLNMDKAIVGRRLVK